MLFRIRMGNATNYCLKAPDDQVVGFRLEIETLGHEIYDILDWADEHFSSHFVEQTEDCVYVCSESAREALAANELRAEPLSIERGGPDGRSGGGPTLGGPSGGGPSGGGSSGGSSGPGGNVPAGSDGGETVAEAGL
jgi:uncharacterized membrane protein YgcG